MNSHKKIFDMVAVFITNVKSETLSTEILQILKRQYPELKFNIDLEDFNKPYPCGHSVLRAEGKLINTNTIIQQLKNKRIKCELLEDKICG